MNCFASQGRSVQLSEVREICEQILRGEKKFQNYEFEHVLSRYSLLEDLTSAFQSVSKKSHEIWLVHQDLLALASKDEQDLRASLVCQVRMSENEHY